MQDRISPLHFTARQKNVPDIAQRIHGLRAAGAIGTGAEVPRTAEVRLRRIEFTERLVCAADGRFECAAHLGIIRQFCRQTLRCGIEHFGDRQITTTGRGRHGAQHRLQEPTDAFCARLRLCGALCGARRNDHATDQQHNHCRRRDHRRAIPSHELTHPIRHAVGLCAHREAGQIALQIIRQRLR